MPSEKQARLASLVKGLSLAEGEQVDAMGLLYEQPPALRTFLIIFGGYLAGLITIIVGARAVRPENSTALLTIAFLFWALPTLYVSLQQKCLVAVTTGSHLLLLRTNPVLSRSFGPIERIDLSSLTSVASRKTVTGTAVTITGPSWKRSFVSSWWNTRRLDGQAKLFRQLTAWAPAAAGVGAVG